MWGSIPWSRVGSAGGTLGAGAGKTTMDANNGNLTLMDQMEKSNREFIAAGVQISACYAVFSFIGFLMSCLVVLTIYKTKELHNKSHCIIASQSLICAFTLLAYHFNGIVKVAFYFYQGSIVHTRRFCLLTQMIWIGFFCDSYYMSVFLLGLDRCLGAYAPIFYRAKLRHTWYVPAYSIVCIGYTALQNGLLYLFTLPDPNEYLPFCSISTSASNILIVTDDISRQTLSYCTVVVYLALFFKIAKHRWGKSTISQTQRREWAKKVQLKAMHGVAIIGGTFLFLRVVTFVNNELANAGVYKNINMNLVIKMYGMLDIIDYSCHFFIYTLVSGEFRNGFKRLVGVKPSTPTISLHSNNDKTTVRKGQTALEEIRT